MSITSSFYTALSGLDTHGTAIGVIGDNIANVHSTGFKASTTIFEDVLGLSLTGVSGSNQTGAGTKVASVDANFIQGSLATTQVGTDVAINGKGFFIVGDPIASEMFYTRAGHFAVDNQGYYINSQGYRVQGYLYDVTGQILIETLADIQLNTHSMVPPQLTTTIESTLNVDAAITNFLSFDITDPAGTAHYSTPITIYDSLGQSHQLQLYFTKTAAQAWDLNVVVDGSDTNDGLSHLYGAAVPLAFDTNGALTTAMPQTLTPAGYTFANGIAPSAIDLDLTDSTQFGSGSAIQRIFQDGYAAGTLSAVSVDDKGNIVGNYTNGTVKNIARLALADFTNLNGLARRGATLYLATTHSGPPLYNKPGEGGMGDISASMLEESNVDIAAEFIKMIIVQRGYQANTKVITTTDEMLAQLLNIR